MRTHAHAHLQRCANACSDGDGHARLRWTNWARTDLCLRRCLCLPLVLLFAAAVPTPPRSTWSAMLLARERERRRSKLEGQKKRNSVKRAQGVVLGGGPDRWTGCSFCRPARRSAIGAVVDAVCGTCNNFLHPSVDVSTIQHIFNFFKKTRVVGISSRSKA